MLRLLRTSIVYRSAFIVLGIALLVGIFFALLSYHFSAKSEQEQARQRTQASLSTVENTASIACFVLDQNLAAELARGLIKNGDISRVQIISDGKVLAEADKQSTQKSEPSALTMLPSIDASSQLVHEVYSPFNSKEKVCEIHLDPNLDFIREQSTSKARFIMYLLLLQALAMASAVVYVVLNMITKPIKNISDRLHTLAPESGDKLCLPDGNEKDEIGQLVRDVNTLVASLLETLNEERTLRIKHAIGEKKFQTIFENAETGIFQLNFAGELLSYNPAFLRMFSLDASSGSTKIANALTSLLEGQELRLHLMIDMAINEAKVMSDDFYIQLAASTHKKWVNLVISPAEDGILQGLVNDITERKSQEESANQLAVTDHLTGINNRLGFEKEISRLSKEHGNGNASGFFLLMIDLDKFKQVNDSHGHIVGDQVLVHFSQLVSNTVRKSDFVARLGGDEFIILLKDLTSLEKAEEIAQKIITLVSEPISINDKLFVQIGASIGISYTGPTEFIADNLLRQADAAMYEVKRSGRNAYRVVHLDAYQNHQDAGTA
ncbi:diguanylate cyclase domain-containing protein [Undibacterium umbellatum]|jgi:diguanylate cyclase (GGDEF)-like protein/PAS domain S-box-containing protein|uniref:Diguanylate cyclase n=1 Tax=Undibacterium umbellatum TaxID=2762300 RepID=A0ABR6Z3Q7_9BURK|nr:diguanylate cyclase [Undibacterium umbellatum]MBC3906426.1 diguanylate cyclase [Undibacterium umbellatum]